jgi:transposase-like protein
MGDNRTDEQVAAKKLLCVLLHFMGNDSFRALGRLFQMDHSLIYRWVREFDENLLKSRVYGEVKRMAVDELQHFMSAKEDDFDSSKSLTVMHGELWSGCLATLILQLPETSVTKKAAA